MEKLISLSTVKAEDLGVLEAQFVGAYPDQFMDLARCLFLALMNHPKAVQVLDVTDMAQIAFNQVNEFCRECGGGNFYLPKNISKNSKERAAKIFEDFDGGNIRQLSKKYKLSEQRIRDILKSLHGIGGSL